MKLWIIAAMLLTSASSWAQNPVAGGGLSPATSPPTPSREQILVSARNVTLVGSVGYVAATGLALNPSGAKAQQILDKEVRKWGRFTVVDELGKADLVFILFEGNRSTGHGGTIRTARLVVFPGGGPPQRGDIPLFDEDEMSGIIPTSAAPKVISRFRSYLESLDKTTPHVQLAARPLATTPVNAQQSAAAQASPSPAASERPHKYVNPLEVIASAKTYTIRGSGAEGARLPLDKKLGRFGGKSSDVQDAMHDIYEQMNEWGRIQFVDEVPKADLVLVVYQWDTRADTRYPGVRSALNVARGGEAYQRDDLVLWTSGTQNGETKGLIGLLRSDVEQFNAPIPPRAESGNKDYERGVKLVESGQKKKYQEEREEAYNEAIRVLRESLRTSYAYPLAHERLATALRLTRFYIDSAYEYKRSLQLQPDMRESLNGLTYALLGIPDYDEAAKAARELIRVAPNSADSYLALGQVQYSNAEYSAAAVSFREAIQRDSSRPILHQKLGRALYRDKHFVEAETSLREAVRLDSDDIDSLTWLGSTLNQEQKPADALVFLRQAESKDKKDADVHFQMGMALRALKKYDEALSEFHSAIDGSPTTLIFHIELARTLESAGRHADALAEFRDIVSHAPDSTIAHTDLGVQLLSMARADEAAAELQSAIGLDAKCARAWFYLGRLRQSKGDQPGAKAAYDTARSLEPDNEEFRD